MPRGGARPGSGRKKGSKNKVQPQAERRAHAREVAGIEPRDFLLRGLRFYNEKIDDELAKGEKADRAEIDRCYAIGREYAKDAAPYVHPKLQAMPHGGLHALTLEDMLDQLDGAGSTSD